MASVTSMPARAPFELGARIHELNNALAPIIMSVELLRRKLADPEAQRQLDLVAGHAWRGAAAARRIMLLAEGRGEPRTKRRGKTRPART